MANFFEINQSKLVKVRPFFSHIQFITEINQAQQRSPRVYQKQAQSLNQLSLYSSRRQPDKRSEKSKLRAISLSTNHPKKMSLYTNMQQLMRQNETDQTKSRRLSLISKLLLLQSENDKKSAEFKKGMIEHLKIKNGKDAFVEKEMRKKLYELNSATQELSKVEVYKKL